VSLPVGGGILAGMALDIERMLADPTSRADAAELLREVADQILWDDLGLSARARLQRAGRVYQLIRARDHTGGSTATTVSGFLRRLVEADVGFYADNKPDGDAETYPEIGRELDASKASVQNLLHPQRPGRHRRNPV
jgi:hypothetical protein